MKIFVIGDSISLQYGPWLKKALEALGIGYSRKGDDPVPAQDASSEALSSPNGGDSSEVLEYLNARAAAAPVDADLVLVNSGIRDIRTNITTGAKQVDIESYRRNLEAIIDTVTDRMHRKMAWIRTTPCDESIHNKPGIPFHRFKADVAAYNAVADTCMAARGIPVIDLFSYTASIGAPADIFFDHVHFREGIRRVQAAYIAGWVDAWRQISK